MPASRPTTVAAAYARREVAGAIPIRSSATDAASTWTPTGTIAAIAARCATTPALASAASQGTIESDAIQPGKELAILLEGIEFNERPNEGFLNDLFGFVRRTGDLQHRSK